MKITAIETFVVDGGMRPWLYCAVRTDQGITGYSEFGTGFPNGMVGLVEDLAENLIGHQACGDAFIQPARDLQPVSKLPVLLTKCLELGFRMALFGGRHDSTVVSGLTQVSLQPLAVPIKPGPTG